MSKDKKKAGGTQGASRGAPAASAASQERLAPRWVCVFVWCILGAAGVLALWALVLTSSQTAEISRFAELGWGQYAPVIVGNKMRALWHAAFMTACGGAALWWLVLRKGRGWRGEGQRTEDGGQRPDIGRQAGAGTDASVVRRPSSVVPILLVVIVALDAWWLSRDYVKTMPRSALDANPVIAILKQATPEHRVALVSQDGFYNAWLTFLFPYHGILTVNVTQMPRMPEDYKNFLGAVGRNPLRLWQLSAVSHVLAPAPVWQQIRQDAVLSNAFELVYGYNVGPAEGGVSVIPVWDARSQESEVRSQKSTDVGQHVVLRLTWPAPRFAVIGSAREVADDEALKLLGSPTYDLFREVLVAGTRIGTRNSEARSQKEDGQAPDAATFGTLTNAGVVGACHLMNYRPGRMEIEVKADKAGILRVSEKYDRAWKASVDGMSVPVQRVDYIMQGVPVPAGQHKVLLWYSPNIWPLYLQGAGLVIVLGAAAWLAAGKLRGRSQSKVTGEP